MVNSIDELDGCWNPQIDLDIFIENQEYRKKWYHSFFDPNEEYYIWLKRMGLIETFCIVNSK